MSQQLFSAILNKFYIVILYSLSDYLRDIYRQLLILYLYFLYFLYVINYLYHRLSFKNQKSTRL